jgi:hypothetical protein
MRIKQIKRTGGIDGFSPTILVEGPANNPIKDSLAGPWCEGLRPLLAGKRSAAH